MEPIRLLGIIEMAGSFQINISRNEKYNSGYSVSVSFILVSKEEKLISDIANTLQGLDIKSKIKGNKITINGLNNILRFNEYITNYHGFVSEARKSQFKQWKIVIELVDCEQHHHIDGINQIKKIKNKLKGGK